MAVDAFRVHLASYFGWEARTVARAFYPWPVESTALRDWLAPLRGHDLACWCPLDQPCHIRHSHSKGDGVMVLSRAYGVNREAIGRILRGITWRHVV